MIHEFTVRVETPDDYAPPAAEVLQDVLHRRFGDAHSRMSFEVEAVGDEVRTDGGLDEDEWPIVDVQADPDAHREAVKTCLTDHFDAGEVDVTSIGRDPRSIIATCSECEQKYWFETVEEAWIPGTDEYAEGPLGGDA